MVVRCLSSNIDIEIHDGVLEYRPRFVVRWWVVKEAFI